MKVFWLIVALLAVFVIGFQAGGERAQRRAATEMAEMATEAKAKADREVAKAVAKTEANWQVNWGKAHKAFALLKLAAANDHVLYVRQDGGRMVLRRYIIFKQFEALYWDSNRGTRAALMHLAEPLKLDDEWCKTSRDFDLWVSDEYTEIDGFGAMEICDGSQDVALARGIAQELKKKGLLVDEIAWHTEPY